MQDSLQRTNPSSWPEGGYLRMRQMAGPDGCLGYSRSKIYADIRAGKFPKPIKIDRISLWRASDILAFLAKREADNG